LELRMDYQVEMSRTSWQGAGQRPGNHDSSTVDTQYSNKAPRATATPCVLCRSN
jgi:hypothetical protein